MSKSNINLDSQLQILVDAVLDGLIVIDEKEIIQSFNPAAMVIFGYALEEVMGQHIKMLMPEYVNGEQERHVWHGFSQENEKAVAISRQMLGKRKDGSIFPVEFSINEMRFNGARMFVAMLRDISEREEAERKNALLAAIVESSDDTIISKSLDGIILSWNRGAGRLLGYSADEAIGRHINLIIPPERREEEQLIISQVKDGKPIEHFETIRMSKDGRRIPIALTVSPVRDRQGKIIGASKIIRDISERKKMESEREHFIEKLTESNAELERFAYICSHDLQEPLRMISSFTQRLEKHLGDALDEKGRHYMKYVTDGTAQARQLISDVLTYAQVEHAADSLANVASETTLAGVLRDLSARIEEAGGRVTHDPLPVIHMQPTHLRQLLQNLIGNALKFCKDAPHIHISAVRDDRFWRFEVRDNGIGIAPEHLQKIFLIFQRLHSRDRYPGTGIGLALCKKVVQRYGGRIWAESKPGEGSSFFFTLPPAVEAQESAAA